MGCKISPISIQGKSTNRPAAVISAQNEAKKGKPGSWQRSCLTRFPVFGGELVKFFLKALAEIVGTGKTHLQGHLQHRPEIVLQ